MLHEFRLDREAEIQNKYSGQGDVNSRRAVADSGKRVMQYVNETFEATSDVHFWLMKKLGCDVANSILAKVDLRYGIYNFSKGNCEVPPGVH